MDINTKFEEIKEKMSKLINSIIDNDNIGVSDSVFQVKKIESTINELKKNNIAVPSELIKLKLSLSSQVDEAKESEKIRKELIRILELSIEQLKKPVATKNTNKEKIKKITINERVNLVDLINAGIIPPNTEVYAYYKNSRFSATLLADGTIEMVVKRKKKVFDSQRSAALAITGYQVDSWKFWRLDFEGKPLILDDYRHKYFKKKQKEKNIIIESDSELA